MPDDFESSVLAADAPGAEAMISVEPSADVPPAGRDIFALAAEIRYWHRQRQFAMNQRKAADNALGAFIRVQLGWSKSLPKAESDAIKARAQDLVGVGEKVVEQRQDRESLAERERAGAKLTKAQHRRLHQPAPVPGTDDPMYREWAAVIEAAVMARAPFDTIEKETTKRMAALAEQTPVWPWANAIRGFGAVSLAQIVAETGLVSCDSNAPGEGGNYPNPAKLWKRMCVAVMDGKRQGGLSKSASKDDWIAHGYSRTRRSIMWNIGEALVKLNDGEYRALYVERKEIERLTAEAQGLIVAPAADIAKIVKKLGKAEGEKYRSVGHIANRARRYMEKRLLRDLWRAWREAMRGVMPKVDLPPAK